EVQWVADIDVTSKEVQAPVAVVVHNLGQIAACIPADGFGNNIEPDGTEPAGQVGKQFLRLGHVNAFGIGGVPELDGFTVITGGIKQLTGPGVIGVIDCDVFGTFQNRWRIELVGHIGTGKL